MDQFLLHLRLLNDILEKKQDALTRILNIMENERTVITAGANVSEAIAMFTGMAGEKQKLIDAVKESDRVFERVFREISPVFEKEAPKHAGLAKRLREGVKRVTALDARIRVMEARRKDAGRVTAKDPHDVSARKRVARIYEQNKSYYNKQPPG